ncbi:hypothetical protein M0811_01530 [Anaeramoeba ignava]|uniref:F-box domain-containing protein n=1 Tax=Anaeramoeba ignava TaxID=1746090 RepID=A0A9Q0LJW5_ANAIG|nr:hypothetical protein M0811_01530 [Anaeramoeba ignava]
MEQFKIKKYEDKLKAKITNDNFNFLKTGEMSEVPTKLKKPPKQENLFIEMLPENVHLYIFQFLSPGSLLKLSMTCKTFNDLSKDINCWRNISFKYWRYFLLKDFENINAHQYHRYSQNRNDDQEIPIYGIIEEPKIINSNLQSIMDKKPQKLIRRQSSISLFINKMQNLPEVSEQNYVFQEKEFKFRTIKYLESIPNPRDELISKSKLIDEKIKERKEKIQKLKRNQEKFTRKINIVQKFERAIISDLIFLGFCVLIFLLSLSGYIDKKLSFNPIYLFIPLLVSILVLSVLLLIQFFYDFDDSKSSDLIMSSVSFLVFAQILVIGLKSGEIIQISWMIIFIPILVLIGMLILISVLFLLDDPNFSGSFSTFGFTMLFLFFILLGLKLDGKIGLNYLKVFFPLFLLDLFPLFRYFGIMKPRRSSSIETMIFKFVLIPFSIFEFLLVRYLESSIPKSISFTFIPFYIELLIFLVYFFF